MTDRSVHRSHCYIRPTIILPNNPPGGLQREPQSVIGMSYQICHIQLEATK